ncbi:MAG: acyl carrier protein phosphodiesterase [Oceanospirillaceae bacterium]|jgi:acyl carrier protein phosphodiesterase
MNFLAHCFLSNADPEALVGNLLGDFSKGVDESALPLIVKEGLINHRAVDKFTDSNSLVLTAKNCFSAPRRRFAGIAVDVLFDHYLIKHWAAFSVISFDQFKAQTYQMLEIGYPLMPASMACVIKRVITQDWFNSYRSIEGVGFALDGIANRIRFKNNFSGCIDDIQLHDKELEKLFIAFFPQIQQFILQRKIIV